MNIFVDGATKIIYFFAMADKTPARIPKRAGNYPGRRTRTPEEVKSLMWRIYQYHLGTPGTIADTARHFKMQSTYVGSLIWRAQNAMKAADKFDPMAADLHKEMRAFVPLATEALKENLEKAEPRVTLGFLQGIGALVNKQEIADVTEKDRKDAWNKTMGAINPKLKQAIGIEDGVEVTIKEEVPGQGDQKAPDPASDAADTPSPEPPVESGPSEPEQSA